MDYLKRFSEVFTPQVISGVILGALVVPFCLFEAKRLLQYLIDSCPARKVMEGLTRNSENCLVCVDRLRSGNGKLLRRLPDDSLDYYANLKKQYIFERKDYELWTEGDSQAAIHILNVLGKLGKTEKLDIVPVGKAWDEWDTNIVCIGGNLKSRNIMNFENNKFYKVEYPPSTQAAPAEVIDLAENKPIQRETGFDYGIILKLRNPYSKGKVIFTVLGTEAMGTQAAGYYLATHLKQLAKEVGRAEFGVLIKVDISSGVQATQKVDIRTSKFKRRSTA